MIYQNCKTGGVPLEQIKSQLAKWAMGWWDKLPAGAFYTDGQFGDVVVVDKTPEEMIITPTQERYCPHCGSSWDGDFCYGCGDSG